jgi:phosphate:Na+ symporter
VRLSESSDEKERQLLQGHLSHLRYIQLIGNCAKDFAECVVEKIKEGLLFSDKAFGEIQNLFQEVEELLNNALVAYTRGDEDLAKKIVERGTAVERLIDNYSSEHEKRLISGVCTVRSSAIFLDMLDALRRISGHAVSMACSVGQLRKG